MSTIWLIPDLLTEARRKRLRDIYLRLAFTEQQLHAGLDEFRMCDKFEDDCRAVSCPQQILRMVDANNTNCLSDRLRSIDTSAAEVGRKKKQSERTPQCNMA